MEFILINSDSITTSLYPFPYHLTFVNPIVINITQATFNLKHLINESMNGIENTGSIGINAEISNMISNAFLLTFLSAMIDAF